MLLEQRRDVLLGGGELLLERLAGRRVEPGALAPGRAPPGAGSGGGRSSKSTTNARSLPVGRLHREDDEVAGLAGGVPVDRDALPAHRGGRLARLGEREAQRCGEAGARHLEELALRLAIRRLEVGTGPSAELEHLQPVVDDHARRPVPGQDHVVDLARQGAVGPRRPEIARGGQRAHRGEARRARGAKRKVLGPGLRRKSLPPLLAGANHFGTPAALSERPRSR